MLTQHKNSKKQGDAGLGAAIAYFTSMGYTVCVPLTDSQDYDLVIDLGDELARVQVKTSVYKNKGKCQVGLRVNGGNRSGEGKTKFFDRLKVEYLFILLDDGRTFCIPSSVVEAESYISPDCAKYKEYKC